MSADCVGGVWSYALQLVNVLQAHGVETVLLVTGAELRQDQIAQALRIPRLHVVSRPWKVEWMPDPELDLAATDELLLELEQEFAPDIVHINGYANAAAGFDCPVVCVAHSCVPSWWASCRGGKLPDEWDAYMRRLHLGLVAADAVVAPTRSYLAMLRTLYDLPHRACAIYNGRDGREFAPGPKRSFALAAGRFWDDAKNLRLLLAARDMFDGEVLVAGGGTLDSAAGGRVSLLGPLSADALARTMAEAAVFVAPARYEPFGLAILEAALSGCALVLGNIPTLRELWGAAACFVDPDDADAMAAAVNRLLADPALAIAQGARARARALRYRADTMGAAYLQLYDSLLASREEQAPLQLSGAGIA